MKFKIEIFKFIFLYLFFIWIKILRTLLAIYYQENKGRLQQKAGERHQNLCKEYMKKDRK